jgi:2-desacetyl-2-hydroxyethyl bacteriochlorophyllide A dehydrogenase
MSIAGQRIVFHGPDDVMVEAVQIAQPGEHEVVVQTTHSLVSAGTELTNLQGELSVFRGYPVYPGYSNVGVVAATGSGVSAPVVGQRIVSLAQHASHFTLNLDPSRPGGPAYWQPVPDAVASVEATFTVLGSVALHGVRKAALQIGEAVVVVGAGVVGQLISQFAYWSGCHPIIVLDFYEERLERALEGGADYAINPATTDASAFVREVTEGRGADVVFEATRSSQTLPLMMKVAGQGGRLMVVGSLPGNVEVDPFSEMQLKELHIIGVFQPAAPTQGHAYFPWTQQRNRKVFLELLAQGKMKVNHLISHRLPYTAAPDAYAMIRRGGSDWLGVVFEW